MANKGTNYRTNKHGDKEYLIAVWVPLYLDKLLKEQARKYGTSKQAIIRKLIVDTLGESNEIRS